MCAGHHSSLANSGEGECDGESYNPKCNLPISQFLFKTSKCYTLNLQGTSRVEICMARIDCSRQGALLGLSMVVESGSRPPVIRQCEPLTSWGLEKLLQEQKEAGSPPVSTLPDDIFIQLA